MLDEVDSRPFDSGPRVAEWRPRPELRESHRGAVPPARYARLWEVETERGSRTFASNVARAWRGVTHCGGSPRARDGGAVSRDEKDAAAAMYNFLVTPTGTKIAHGIRDLAGYADIDERRRRTRSSGRSRRNGSCAQARRTGRQPVTRSITTYSRMRLLPGARGIAPNERSRPRSEERRRAFAVATASLVALILVAAIAVFALVQRSHSAADARRAHARELAAAPSAAWTRIPAKGSRSRCKPLGSRVAIRRRTRCAGRSWWIASTLSFVPVDRFAHSHSTQQVHESQPARTTDRVRVYTIGASVPSQVLDQGGAVTAVTYGPNRPAADGRPGR